MQALGAHVFCKKKTHKMEALDFKLWAVSFQDLLSSMSQVALNAHAGKPMQHQDEMDFKLSNSQEHIHIFPSRGPCFKGWFRWKMAIGNLIHMPAKKSAGLLPLPGGRQLHRIVLILGLVIQ